MLAGDIPVGRSSSGSRGRLSHSADGDVAARHQYAGRDMTSSGSAASALQGLVVVAIIGAIGTWSLVSYAQSYIQRGARWVGSVQRRDGAGLCLRAAIWDPQRALPPLAVEEDRDREDRFGYLKARHCDHADPGSLPGPPTDIVGNIIRFCGGAGSRRCQTTPVLRGLAQTPARLPQLSFGLVGSILVRLSLFGQVVGSDFRLPSGRP